MKRRHKAFIKANIMSLFFIAVSFISGTLAWFAYSGLSDVATKIDIRAWSIEIDKDTTSKNITITLPEISPGMETMSEIINIKNSGDSDALIKYSIVSARILDKEEDNYVVSDTLTSKEVEDALANNYPFQINAALDKEYVLKKGGESSLEVSVAWPFDSGDDDLDSLWGTNAYNFLVSEAAKAENSDYKVKSPIEVVIKLTAEQMVDSQLNVPDSRFDLGQEILYDTTTKQKCTEMKGTCIKTYVIDKLNLRSDETVTLIPDFNSNFGETNFTTYESVIETLNNTEFKPLDLTKFISAISKDISNTFVVREGYSDKILGYVDYKNENLNRMEIQIADVIDKEAYYKYLNSKFSFLKADTCIWTNMPYGEYGGFAIGPNDENTSKIYKVSNESQCKIIPIIEAEKNALIS